MNACEEAEKDAVDALTAMMDEVGDNPPVPIVLIGFSGRPSTLSSLLRSFPNVHVTFNGTVTYRSAGNPSMGTDSHPVESLLSAVFDVPLQRLLLASDAPFSRPRIEGDSGIFPGYDAHRDDAGYSREISEWKIETSERENPPSLPRHIPLIASRIAAEKRLSLGDLLAKAQENAARVFGISFENSHLTQSDVLQKCSRLLFH